MVHIETVIGSKKYGKDSLLTPLSPHLWVLDTNDKIWNAPTQHLVKKSMDACIITRTPASNRSLDVAATMDPTPHLAHVHQPCKKKVLWHIRETKERKSEHWHYLEKKESEQLWYRVPKNASTTKRQREIIRTTQEGHGSSAKIRALITLKRNKRPRGQDTRISFGHLLLRWWTA